MAKTLGQFIAKFRNAQNEMSEVIKKEVYDSAASDPSKKPAETAQKLAQDAKKEDLGESFAERKARYDKQRAARKAAEEARRAEEGKKSEEAVKTGAGGRRRGCRRCRRGEVRRRRRVRQVGRDGRFRLFCQARYRQGQKAHSGRALWCRQEEAEVPSRLGGHGFRAQTRSFSDSQARAEALPRVRARARARGQAPDARGRSARNRRQESGRSQEGRSRGRSRHTRPSRR